jgi:hypothetical protein
MSMGESNVFKISQNLLIFNCIEKKINSTQLIKKIQKFSKMKNNLIYAKTVHVLHYTWCISGCW